MKHTTLATAAGLAAVLAAATPSHAVTISTAVGAGADVQLSANTTDQISVTDTSGNGQSMNSRFNVATPPSASNNEIIALRFDLSGYDLSTAINVSLNLFSYRDDTSNRAIQVYGVTPFAVGKDNNGTVAGFNTTTWSETSVKFSTMPGLEWDNTTNATDFDLDTTNTTLLGSATLTGAELGLGTVHMVSGASFDSFIQSHTTTSLVTILVRAGNTSTGQARFGTKESTGLNGATGAVAAGTYAPYLNLTVSSVPEPSAFAALAGVAGLGVAALRRRRSV